MRIHEYQAKKLFADYGITTPNSVLISTPSAASAACAKLGGCVFVVKAQIHAGGRGKSGGVVVCHSVNEVVTACDKLLATKLSTVQTNKQGLPVNKVLIEAGQSIKTEMYLGLVIDQQSQKITVLASTKGGIDIEEVAVNSKSKIIKYTLDPLGTLLAKDCHNIAKKLNISSHLNQQWEQILMGLYALFTTKDATLIEINPLIISEDNALIALDGKIEFDDNALYRQPDILILQDISQEDEKERLAKCEQLSYVSLDGSIGCMVNGAGLAMATMDLIEHFGASAANFLDVGGDTTPSRVAKAFLLIQSEPNVKAILVNIFGGIVRCDLIAKGILQAIQKIGLHLPIVVRLSGTNAADGLAILAQSPFNIHTESDLNSAIKHIIKIAK